MLVSSGFSGKAWGAAKMVHEPDQLQEQLQISARQIKSTSEFPLSCDKQKSHQIGTTISIAYILLEKGGIVLWHLQINFQKNIDTNISNKFYMPIELLLRFHSLSVSLSTISSHFATQVFPICKMCTAVFTGKGKYDQANFPLDQPSLPSNIF